MAEKDLEPIKNESNAWASLIPDFFYVLIGRAIPGCLFIIGLVYALDKKNLCRLLFNESITLKAPDIILKYDPPYTLIFILLLIVSYASGLILSLIGDWLGEFYIYRQYKEMLLDFHYIVERLWDLAGFKKDILPTDWTSKGKEFCEGITDKECRILFQRQHDYVKQEYAHQARSLSRSEAEGQLLIITAAAYLLLSIFTLLSILSFIFSQFSINFFKELSQRWDLLVFPVIAIFSFKGAQYRNERFLMRQFSFSAEIKRREENPEKPKSKTLIGALL